MRAHARVCVCLVGVGRMGSLQLAVDGAGVAFVAGVDVVSVGGVEVVLVGGVKCISSL